MKKFSQLLTLLFMFAVAFTACDDDNTPTEAPVANAGSAGAGRADRGHPAQHRARDRRYHQTAQHRAEADRGVGGAEAALREAHLRPLLHHGQGSGGGRRRGIECQLIIVLTELET